MKQVILALTILIAGWTGAANARDTVVRDDLTAIFDAHGVQGTFALLDVTSDRLVLVGAQRAGQGFIPASTFKIANSLIALESARIVDENEIIPYGGAPQPIEAWEQDMSLRDAFRVSNVPVFQTLARRVGHAEYVDYLARLDFGNGQVGDDVTSFWLSGPLEISAVDYTGFLARLARGDLPISKRSQSIVRDIARLEQRGDATLYGKTGWTIAPDPDIGWFVGWVERNDTLHSFALNIDMKSRDDASKREDIAKALLVALGVF